jgi:hypothetical protein
LSSRQSSWRQGVDWTGLSSRQPSSLFSEYTMTRPEPKHDPFRERSGIFLCIHCGAPVTVVAAGTEHRNHCPRCLHSKHVDLRPGDRLSACGGEMEPIAVWVRADGEWAIVHRCRRCTSLKSNRIAGDDCPTALLRLAARPLANPPFSLEELQLEDPTSHASR